MGERRCAAAAASPEVRRAAWLGAEPGVEVGERRCGAAAASVEVRRAAWLGAEPGCGGGGAPLRSGGGERGGEASSLAGSRARVWRWVSAAAERRRRAWR